MAIQILSPAHEAVFDEQNGLLIKALDDEDASVALTREEVAELRVLITQSAAGNPTITNRFWVDGFPVDPGVAPLTEEDRAVIACLGNINISEVWGDTKTSCEYALRRAYRCGAADAQPRIVTNKRIDELLNAVRDWLATLNQPPATNN